MNAFAAGGRMSLALLLAIAFGPAFLHAQDARIHHDLKVTLNPGKHRLSAADAITLPDDSPREMSFALHAGMKPAVVTAGVSLVKVAEIQESVPLELYQITLPPGVHSLALSYKGAIYHSAENGPAGHGGKGPMRSLQETPGIISPEGIFLSANSAWYPMFIVSADSAWYPLFKSAQVTFDLEVQMPSAWDAVSQGMRAVHQRGANLTTVRWKSPQPQESIFLIAAPFTEYTRAAGPIEAMVFLRSPNQSLADAYLAATARYVAMYDRLLGPYPYGKFALVENFSETGLGMPSFTLLGPTVIRLPFIINSSYPHEILHNWWGNGVYVDYRQGNWCEGLTAYLADHLLREQQGGGVEYRSDTLQKYTNYVRGGKDFPLTQFRSRHDPSTEAVGYGKSLMLFHMLRRELGDDVFIRGLREFYRKYKFRPAAFDDIRTTLESVSGKNLKEEFDQWVTRPGAPQLKIGKPVVERDGGTFVLTALLQQTQPEKPFHLKIPVAVTLEGREAALQTTIDMQEKTQPVRITLPARPLRLDVDPEFDLFRRLDRGEMPPALSLALGAKKMLIVLPSAAAERLLQGYRIFAQSLARSGPDEVEIKLDSEVAELPADRAITILGWENRFLPKLIESLTGYDVTMNQESARINGSTIPREGHCFALTTRMANHRDQAMSFIAADLPEALPGLAVKLPHYNKYSYLGFSGAEPVNMAKGRWPVVASPLTVFPSAVKGEPAKARMGKLAARNPLAKLDPLPSAHKMGGMNSVRRDPKTAPEK
jgi:hypothetical protein